MCDSISTDILDIETAKKKINYLKMCTLKTIAHYLCYYYLRGFIDLCAILHCFKSSIVVFYGEFGAGRSNSISLSLIQSFISWRRRRQIAIS